MYSLKSASTTSLPPALTSLSIETPLDSGSAIVFENEFVGSRLLKKVEQKRLAKVKPESGEEQKD